MSTAISHHSFLRDVVTIDIQPGQDVSSTRFTPTGIAVVDQAATTCCRSGLPSIATQSIDRDESHHDSVVLCVPIYRQGVIVSAVAFIGNATTEHVGVMEVWQPIGQYDELNLTHGYFGPLDRFQNVSSFVRFEKGAGLPGQVWRNLSFVVHDNLPSHAGFLRAAGASAGSLQLAIGMPVLGEEFLASALLISSDASPIARGYEVWRRSDYGFRLESAAYQHMRQELMRAPESELSPGGNLPALAVEHSAAVISDDPSVVYADSPFDGTDCKGVAIPFFEDDRITNILTLLI